MSQNSQVFADGGYTDRVANVSAALTRANQLGQVGPGGFYDAQVAAPVKIFERVDGATITGETNATNGTATVALELETGTGRPFQYVQHADVEDGEFEVTVPYPTAETLGPEDGYANASVRMAEGASGYSVLVQNETGSIVESAQNVTVGEELIQTGGSADVEFEPSEPDDGTDESEDNTEGDGGDGQNDVIGAPVDDE